MYRNEAEVGRAITDSGVARDEVFVTTKYNPRSGGDELDILEHSLAALGTDHVDLWLVHAPASDNVRVWENFVAAQSDGQARDIGVSNFSLAQVDRVHEATGVLPSVNQIEWRPSLYDARVVEGHATRGVVLEGYSALRGGSCATLSSAGSPTTSAGRPPRCWCAGTSSTASWSSPAPPSPTGYAPTPTSVGSRCPTSRWPPSTLWGGPADVTPIRQRSRGSSPRDEC